MIERTTYCCEWCNEIFDTKDKCIEHETTHSIDDKIKMVPNSKVCPNCEGKGEVEDKDHLLRYCIGWPSKIPMVTCELCKGKKIVVMKQVWQGFTVNPDDIRR